MSGGKGKRGPSAPLATTSDEDEPGEAGAGSPPTPPPTPGSCSPANPSSCTPSPPHGTLSPPVTPSCSSTPTTEHDYALPDHDYENVSSPGNSSTASGPTYVRQPGFTHHAHEVTVVPTPPTSAPTATLVSRPKIKKKKTTLLAVKDGLKKREPTPPKTRPKREPLPMRLRALPQSFWQQPNVPHTVSPGTAYPILPPLCTKDGEEVEDEMRPVTPPDDRESREKTVKPPRIPERKIIVANTDLLFKLFEGIEKEGKKGSSSSSSSTSTTTMKRGRPRKVVPCANKTFVSGEDPYLVDCVSEKLFPQLSLENCGKSTNCSPSYGSNSTMLQVVTIREGDKCINLPSLSIEQNYSQMLSELVMHI